MLHSPEDELITGSFYDNIQYINPYLSTQEIDLLCTNLHLMDEFSNLPMGLNTLISAKPHSFSLTIRKALNMLKLYASTAPIKLIDGLHREHFKSKTWAQFSADLKNWRGTTTIIIVTEDELLNNFADQQIQVTPNNSLSWVRAS